MTLFYLPEESILGSHSLAVSCKGERIFVGSPYDRQGNNAGAVYVLDANTGNLLQTIQQPCPEQNDNFGTSVSTNCDGTKLLVGAKKGYGSSTGFKNPGIAYLFSIQNDSTSSLLQIFHNPEPQDFDEFGTSVDMDKLGRTMAISAPHHDRNAGVVFVYDETGSLQRKIRPPVHHQGITDFNINDQSQHKDKFFGTSISISGTGESILVGAPGKGWTKQLPGAAYLYSTSTGELLRTISNPDSRFENGNVPANANDYFAATVALNENGSRIAVGAMLADQNSKSRINSRASGRAYLFDGIGNLLSTMVSPVNVSDVHFGISVSIDANGDRILVGAPHRNKGTGDSKNTAVAYLFEAGIMVKQIQSPTQLPGIHEDVQFGGSVVLAYSGEHAAVSSAFHPAVKQVCLKHDDNCPPEDPDVLRPLPAEDKLVLNFMTKVTDFEYTNRVCNVISVNHTGSPFHNKRSHANFMIGITMGILCACVLILSKVFIRRKTQVECRVNKAGNMLHRSSGNLQTTPKKVLSEII